MIRCDEWRWEWRDLNSHDRNGQQILSLVCLPIPPHSQKKLGASVTQHLAFSSGPSSRDELTLLAFQVMASISIRSLIGCRSLELCVPSRSIDHCRVMWSKGQHHQGLPLLHSNQLDLPWDLNMIGHVQRAIVSSHSCHAWHTLWSWYVWWLYLEWFLCFVSNEHGL